MKIFSTVDADANWSYIWGSDPNHSYPSSNGTALTADPNHTSIVNIFTIATENDAERAEGQLVYHNSARVITVTFHAVVDHDLDDLVQVAGTAVQATKAST
jgi:hypothetical protein